MPNLATFLRCGRYVGMTDIKKPSRPHRNENWARDGARFFGRDAHVTPWQMRDVQLSDLDGDERCHDDDSDEIAGAFRALRGGKRSAKFIIGQKSVEYAHSVWLDNRAQHQAALAASRGEAVDPKGVPVLLRSTKDRDVKGVPTEANTQMPDVVVSTDSVRPRKMRFGTPPANADPITTWVKTPGSRRSWNVLKQTVSEPQVLATMVKIVWELRYGTSAPVPDEVILVTRKKGKGDDAHAHELHIFPSTPEMQKSVDERYEVYARLTIRHRSSDECVLVSPSRGRSAQELMQQSVGAQTDVDVKSAAARNLIAQISGGKDNAISSEEKLMWQSVLEFVQMYARNLVPKIESITAEVKPDADFLLPECALTVLKTMPGEGASSFRLLPVAIALELGAQYSVVLLKQHSLMRYYIASLQGGNAIDVGLAWLEGMGMPVSDAIERYWVSTGWRSGNVHNLPPVEWSEYLAWVENNAVELPFRQLSIARYLNNPFIEEDALSDEDEGADYVERPTPRGVQDLTWSMRRASHDKKHWLSSTQLDFDTQAAESRGRDSAIIKWGVSDNVPFMQTIQGTGALDVALAWLRGKGIVRNNRIEAGFVAGTWGYPISWNDRHLGIDGSYCAPRWETEFLPYVQTMGSQFLPRMRQLFEAVRGSSPNELVVVFQRIKRPHGYDVGNMQVITPEELDKIPNAARLLRIWFAKDVEGHEELRQIKGVGKDEVKPLVLDNQESGGVVFAPDAGQMEEHAQQLASYGSENFGNVDAKLCKPEPLITPADVMPMPKLEYPADAVMLPRLGGFETTDPEAAKKFATPPSDKIPVVSTIAAMVIGAIIVRFGGAAALRVPTLSPSFGSGNMMLSPCDRNGFGGT